MISRREFLKAAAVAGAGMCVPLTRATDVFGAPPPPPPPLLNTGAFAKFVDELPRPGAFPKDTATYPGFDYYEIHAANCAQVLHPQMPAPTPVWGYGMTPTTASWPAGTISATRGTPVKVKWINSLAGAHPLAASIDHTLHGTDMGEPDVRITTHVHGAEVPSESDGNPDTWFTPNPAAPPNGMGGPPGNFSLYHYPNNQGGATLWYHDHSMAMTRLNTVAGLAGFYLLRDPAVEPALNLPSGPYEVGVAIQDRTFNPNGTLFYPTTGINPTLHPQWMPEFFGDTIVVNGKIWPKCTVYPRRYRFRLLNGSTARFYELSMSTKQPFWQIGTDQGFLPKPVAVARLLIAPGERADCIVDFTGLAPGTMVTVTNAAKTPYPNGAPPGSTTTGQIMRFQVVAAPVGTPPDTSFNPAAAGATLVGPIAPLVPTAPTRSLTLNEVMGPAGPFMVLCNNTAYGMPVTEKPAKGAVEVWEIINMTADTHPIHLHLVQFQVLNRQAFQANKYMKAYMASNPMPADIWMSGHMPVTAVPVAPYLLGAPAPPAPNEAGWKDTVRMNPGQVTRIVAKFDGGWPALRPDGTPWPDVRTGPGYVWHCHIIDHEDNEMMRPLVVV